MLYGRTKVLIFILVLFNIILSGTVVYIKLKNDNKNNNVVYLNNYIVFY